ncbi:MAG: hypothetical protein F6K17_13065, partial [Okeania sp. SIO3C4]|nr:hypothetical protein [Okeania sp. SIO3C4]
LKLEAILSKEFGVLPKEFGVGGIGKTNGQVVFQLGDYIEYHQDFKASRDKFENIRESLDQYIKSQISKPNDEIDPAPQELQRYLESKADALKKLQNHVLNSQLSKPNTAIDYLYRLNGDFSVVSPVNDSMAYFQQTLALDILEKQRQGKNQEAREMLKVSWQINQFLKNYSDLPNQPLVLMIDGFQTGVIRKVDNLSPDWQERLLVYDYRSSILKTIDEWLLSTYNFTRNLDWYRDNRYTGVRNFTILVLISSNPLSKPYLRLSAVNYYKTMTQELKGLPTRNVCSPEEKVTTHLAWWNIIGISNFPLDFASEELEAAKYMLELELTQKILQVKELAKQQGKWPDSFPNLDSKFCPDRQYVYQVSEDGTMTISLDKQPEWAKDRDLPLTYSDRTPPK